MGVHPYYRHTFGAEWVPMPEVIYSRATDSSEALKDVPFPDGVKQEALLRYVLMLKVMKD